MTAVETARMLRDGRCRAVDLAAAVLERVAALDPELNCFTAVFAEQCLAQAEAADERIASGTAGLLDGVVVSVKDLIAVAGAPLTRGSALFRDLVAPSDAPVVERAKAAGSVIVGKTTTSELGWKCVTDAPLFGATRNPWDTDRTAGGSSGGAAAAVAAGLGAVGIGTDAAGSIRIPAAFCGVVGLKPTFAAIPVYPTPAPGAIVHLGVTTRSVDDAALALRALAGPDRRDRFSAAIWRADGAADVDPGAGAASPAQGRRVAWTTDFGHLPVDDEVAGTIARAAAVLADRGLAVHEIETPMPDLDEAFRTYFHAALGAQLRGLDESQLEVIDPGLREVVVRSGELSAHDMIAADLARASLWDYVRALLDEADAVLCPVAGTAAFPLGTDRPPHLRFDPETDTGWLGFTYPFNLVGVPALAVPSGRTADGLPIGAQLVARHWDESTLFTLGKVLEEELGDLRRPPLGADR